jgi:hypothetical protein
MLAVDLDLAIEFCELAVRCPEKLMDRKSDCRMRLVEFVSFARERERAQNHNGSTGGNDS